MNTDFTFVMTKMGVIDLRDIDLLINPPIIVSKGTNITLAEKLVRAGINKSSDFYKPLIPFQFSTDFTDVNVKGEFKNG